MYATRCATSHVTSASCMHQRPKISLAFYIILPFVVIAPSFRTTGASDCQHCAEDLGNCAPVITWHDIEMASSQSRTPQTSHNQHASIYVSVVAAGRNDDYGGGRFIHRAQLFVSTTIAFACKAFTGRRPEFELVLVDYNPPANVPALSDALHWPSGCEVRECSKIRSRRT
jgi:hypothetical protein